MTSSGRKPESPRFAPKCTRDLGVLCLVASGLFCAGCVLDLAPPLAETEGGVSPTLTAEPSTDTDTGETNVGTDVDGTGSADVPTQTDAPVTTDVETTDTTDASTDIPAMTDVGPEGCPLDEESCDGACVPLGNCEPTPPSCEEICSIPHATTACVDGVCTFVACDDAWVDCDGSLMDGIVEDPASDDGCEVEFGTGVSEDEPLQVSPLTNPTEADWDTVDVFRLLVTCSTDDCGPDYPEVPAQVDLYVNALPEADSDLRAGFSMGWDMSALWVRVVMLDEDWVDSEDVDGLGGDRVADPRFYDHVEFVLDGANLDRYGDAEDHHLFMGFDGGAFDQRENNINDRVSVDVETRGLCRIMESKLSEGYISSTSPTSLLSVDNILGFSIAVNDFDHVEGDEGYVQRQHRLFYKNPGPAYVYNNGAEDGGRALPEMTLIE